VTPQTSNAKRVKNNKASQLFVVWGVFLLMLGVTGCLSAQSLTKIVDVPLPGQANRFDYQSFDPTTNTLYFTHMGDGELVVFDTVKRRVIANLAGFSIATGVIVVPELHRVFVSVAGSHVVAVVDTKSLKVLASIPAGDFPDGLAYATDAHKLFVSDESGEKEIVIDAISFRRVDTIDMNGEVGNTQYGSVSHQIFANVQTRNELVVIDPNTDTIIGRHALTGCKGAHGLLLLESQQLAFVACEANAKLLVVDLQSFRVNQVLDTGNRPDVLAYDHKLQRLYVATESNIVSVFQLGNRELSKLEDLSIAPHAHTVSVNSNNGEVYFPLQNIDKKPVLRIYESIKVPGHYR